MMDGATQDGPLLLLTVDAEEEWNWDSGFPSPPFQTRNIERIPAFQEMCAEIGVKPTYFVDQAVVDNPISRDIIARFHAAGECDVGAQLHPWCTPPISETLSERNSHTINLPAALAEDKLGHLTESLTRAFGMHPFSFRCGRWGMNGPLARMLAEFGYRIDSSVRPFYRTEHFDYSGAPTRPYWPSFDDVTRPGEQRELLEVPVSDGFTHAPFERLERWSRRLDTPLSRRLHIGGLLSRINLVRHVSMSPEGMRAIDLRRCLDAYSKRKEPVINLFLHSSDLLPGGTTYASTEKEVRALLSVLRATLEHASRHGNVRSVGMREVIHETGHGENDRQRPA